MRSAMRADPALRTSKSDSPPRTLRDWLARVDDRFMGSPVDIAPHEAILLAVRMTAGEVFYCDQQIRKLHEDELFERPLTTVLGQLPNGAWTVVEEKRDALVLSRWVALRDNAVDRMARYSKMALDIGLDERAIKLAERQAGLVSDFFEKVLSAIDITEDQRKLIGPAMRKYLPLIEGREAISTTLGERT